MKLGKLIVFYDDNKITIDGETDISFTEDVIKRFESYGWHTSFVQDGDDDINSIQNAIQAAKKVTDKPSLIKIQTTIGFGSLNQGLEKVHGAPLSAADIKQLKEKFNLPDTSFTVSDDVYKYYHDVSDKNLLVYQDWVKLMNEYSLQFPELYAEFIRRQDRQLPKDWESYFPTYSPSDPAIATRKLSENVLNKIADQIPELIGGSADLTGIFIQQRLEFN